MLRLARPGGRPWSEQTIAAYRAIWLGYLEFLGLRGVEATGATPADVEAFLQSQAEATTARRYAALLRRVYERAIEAGMLHANPVQGIDARWWLPLGRPAARTLPGFQVAEFVAALPEPKTQSEVRDQAIVALMLGAGLRLQELRALPVNHLIETGDALTVLVQRRGLPSRVLTVDEPWRELVRRWMGHRQQGRWPGLLVFPWENGKALPTATLNRHIGALLAQVYPDEQAERLSAGVLRATFAHEVARREGPKEVQARLGHQRRESTKRLLEGVSPSEDGPPR